MVVLVRMFGVEGGCAGNRAVEQRNLDLNISTP